MDVGHAIVFGVVFAVGAVAIVYRQVFTQPKPNVSIVNYSSKCRFCTKKTIKIKGTCSGIERVPDCIVDNGINHSHVKCSNCGATYLMKPVSDLKWYD